VDHPRRPAAKRTLEVAVLDERERRAGVSAVVIAGRVDGRVERHRQRRGALAAQDGREPEDGPAAARGEHRGEQDADGGLLARGRGAERQPDDQQRDGEADTRDRRAADDLTFSDALG
jgi:hypothetical protein